MASIRLDKVSKTFGRTVVAVRHLTLDVPDGGVLTIVGPSGCGKTTVLRLIAGLEKPDNGDILFNARSVVDVSPKHRNISMVFQGQSLYPHMTVGRNLAFALHEAKMTTQQVKKRVEEVSGMLDITDLLDRKPHTLSGGQYQRAALGKAIVRRCDVCLLDEPLANLDAQARISLRTQLQKVLRTVESTVIYVTHDQSEAMAIGDLVCVMDRGGIQQIASPKQLYEQPANRFVARFIGTPAMNLIPGRLVNEDGHGSFACDDFRTPLPPHLIDAARKYGQKTVTLGIRPRDMICLTEHREQDTVITGKVISIEPQGSHCEICVESQRGITLVACVESDSAPARGDRVHLQLNSAKMFVFEDSDQGTNIVLRR